jgi:hypothetical protein
MTPGMKGAVNGLSERSKYLRYVYQWAQKSKTAISKQDKSSPDYTVFMQYLDEVLDSVSIASAAIDDLVDLLQHEAKQ